MSSTFRWWAKFLGVVLLPFLLAVTTYRLALLIPGIVKVSFWENSISIVFLSAAVLVAVSLFQSHQHWLLRFLLGSVAIPVLLFSAFIMQVHSTCDERPTHIGKKPKAVAQCS